jgi:hypothetical protein
MHACMHAGACDESVQGGRASLGQLRPNTPPHVAGQLDQQSPAHTRMCIPATTPKLSHGWLAWWAWASGMGAHLRHLRHRGTVPNGTQARVHHASSDPGPGCHT